MLAMLAILVAPLALGAIILFSWEKLRGRPFSPRQLRIKDVGKVFLRVDADGDPDEYLYFSSMV